jgi:serine/threonine-protein phosphatase 6 regulatory ankyrin repeat subunit B
MKKVRSMTFVIVLLLPVFLIAQPEEVVEAYTLHNAIRMNDIEKVKNMIDEGADVNFQYNGRNALHAACKSGSVEMVKIVVDAGANIDDRRDQGKGITTLQHAIRSFSIPAEIVKVLLESGAKVNETGPDGNLAIFDGIRRAGDEQESFKIVKLLIDHGAELNPEGNKNSTALIAAMHKRPDILELLLKNGADPNKHNKELKYPIHYAVQNKDLQSVRLLKKYEAVLEVKDKAGKTALDYAEDKAKMMAFNPKSQNIYQEIVDELSNEP